MLEHDMNLKEKAENLIAFARGSNENELDNVIKAVVNLIQQLDGSEGEFHN